MMALGDEVVLVATAAALASANAVVWFQKRSIVHPFAIMSLCFFVPLLAAGARLSGLQEASWAYETHVVILEAVIVWGAFLLVGSLATSSRAHGQNEQRPRQ